MRINPELFNRLVTGSIVLAGLGLGSAVWSADTAQKPAAAAVAKPAMTENMQGRSWSSLTEWQKSVLSILEIQWPKISSQHQADFINDANNWIKMQPAEQKAIKEKMYMELGKKMP